MYKNGRRRRRRRRQSVVLYYHPSNRKIIPLFLLNKNAVYMATFDTLCWSTVRCRRRKADPPEQNHSITQNVLNQFRWYGATRVLFRESVSHSRALSVCHACIIKCALRHDQLRAREKQGSQEPQGMFKIVNPRRTRQMDVVFRCENCFCCFLSSWASVSDQGAAKRVQHILFTTCICWMPGCASAPSTNDVHKTQYTLVTLGAH